MRNDDVGAAASDTPTALLAGIDRGIEAHLAWNQHLMRCSLLRESPGDSVLRPDAHMHCQFGAWFASRRHDLDAFDKALVQNVDQAHRRMHDAVRSMCTQVLAGGVAATEDLHAYEQAQSAMVAMLNRLRASVAAAQTHRDPLTGLPLRHGLASAFRLRYQDALRGGAQLWLAMIDVDHFKSVNDAHGHTVGDSALQHIAMCLAGCLRESDALFRFGGEEFLGLFLVHGTQGIERLALRVVEAVSCKPLTTASGIALHLAVTVGLARVRADEDLPSATGRADRALLLGKARGRGRFVLAPD